MERRMMLTKKEKRVLARHKHSILSYGYCCSSYDVVLREIYYSIIPVFVIILALSFMVHRLNPINSVVVVAAETSSNKQQLEEELHPSLLVDTKYWIRSTEFGERDNWRHRVKPCTLLERIRINERAVVSMGDSLDTFGGNRLFSVQPNIRDLSLAMDGMLLFEGDTLAEDDGGGAKSSNKSDDSLYSVPFIEYLKEFGDCSEAGASSATPEGDHLFEFELDSDQLSWFNPDNWASSLIDSEINDLVPESHQVPCSEDVVVFGSKHLALGPTIKANERSKLLSFKVNFEPSKWAIAEWAPKPQPQITTTTTTGQMAGSNSDNSAYQTKSTTTIDGWGQPTSNVSVNEIRVSRLQIGDLTFGQHELDQLLSSKLYENILFEFNSTNSALKPEIEYHDYQRHSLLTIDESSILPDSSQALCLDEAGCLCGNENTNSMKLICSFREQIDDFEQPCNDPIQSAGYCSKICATIITISMDPTRFSERFVHNLLFRMLTNGEVSAEFAGSVFTGARRTYDTKYELTFRSVPNLEVEHSSLNGNGRDSIGRDGASLLTSEPASHLGKEQEFAKLVYEKLNNGAIKSFYGIRSLSVKSSVDWRRNNRGPIFWLSYFVLSLAGLSIFIVQHQSYFNERVRSDRATINPNQSSQQQQQQQLVHHQASNWFKRATTRLSAMGGQQTRTTTDYNNDDDDYNYDDDYDDNEETKSFVRYTEPKVVNDLNQIQATSTSSIPLVDLESVT